MTAVQYIIDTRHHKQGQQCTVDQTSDRDDCHGLHHIRTHTHAHSHSDKAEDGGERCHYNGAQTGTAGFLDRRPLFHAVLAELIDVIHKHDTIVYNDARQHDKSNHCHNADRLVADKKAQETACKCQWNGEHDNERREQGLELCHHDQVHEHKRQRQHLKELPHGLIDALVLTFHFNCVPLRYGVFVKDLLYILAYKPDVITGRDLRCHGHIA